MARAAGVVFRSWCADDLAFLWDMLYESIHVRDGYAPPPRTVVEQPEFAHYLTRFGERPGDDAQLALDESGQRIGAAFFRRLDADDPGYGFVHEDVPEVGLAVVKQFRAHGIGRELLTDLLERHPTMSLSVDETNDRAIRLYETLGFVVVNVEGTSHTMLRRPPTSNHASSDPEAVAS